jgi:hypothetical protein
LVNSIKNINDKYNKAIKDMEELQAKNDTANLELTEKKKTIENLNKTRNLGLGPAEIKSFVNIPSVGVPFSQLKSLLSLSPDQQKALKQPGIPAADSTGGELYYWVRDALSAYSGRKLNLCIKADNNTKYPAYKNVLNAFKKNDQNKFLLITAPEDAPSGSPLFETRQKQIDKK